MSRTIDSDVIAAALVGYESSLAEIDAKIAGLRRLLGATPPIAREHRISAEGRARIAAAQRKRWAASKRATSVQPPRKQAKAKRTAAGAHDDERRQRPASQSRIRSAKQVQTRRGEQPPVPRRAKQPPPAPQGTTALANDAQPPDVAPEPAAEH